MVTRQIVEDEAVVPLEVRGVHGQEIPIRATIDTGFTRYLTLPPALITALSLPSERADPVVLGNGDVVVMSVFLATILWDGNTLDISVYEAEGSPLIGMRLLRGSRLMMDVVDGGPVTIEPLP